MSKSESERVSSESESVSERVRVKSALRITICAVLKRDLHFLPG